MILELLASLPIIWLLWKLLCKDPPPLMGIYSQPGKWYYIKFALAFLMIHWRKRQWHRREKNGQMTSAGYGMVSHNKPDLMEQIQPLSEESHAIDTVYFNGMNKDGTFLIARLCRRQNRCAEIWLSILLSDGRFYQLPIHPATMVYNTSDMKFAAAGLKMECLEPLKRWRISYNGLLREGLCNEYTEDKGKTVHVKFSFIWTTFSDVFNCDKDGHTSLLAAGIAREHWSKAFFNRLKREHQTHYEQWGEMHGTIKVQGYEDQLLYLRGMRDHSYGFRDWRMFHRYIINMVYLENGTTFHVSTVSFINTLTNFSVGYVSLPNATMVPVTSTDLNLAVLGENHNPPDQFTFNFTAGGILYSVKVNCVLSPVYYHEEDWGNVVYEKLCQFEVNGVKGYGVSEFTYRRLNSTSPLPKQESLPHLKEPDLALDCSNALVLPFLNPGCCFSKLVGGKGCQMGLLTQLHSKDFIIPQGFCITVKAFEHQIQINPNLSKHIAQIEEVASGKCSGSLELACSAMCDALKATEMATDIRKDIASELIKQFGSNYGDVLFAVRSSAFGEDSCDMSAAGQMDTFLGVKGLSQLFEAVTKCWSSQFALPAVEYRRQHGQLVCCGIAVVIQKMVSAEVAGVLFTCDPVSGNPASMIINANYGLGESVVSGCAEPDTIIINRSWDDQLTIGRKQIGHKQTHILLRDAGGVEVKTVDKNLEPTCCLSDDLIIRLGKIGVELEKRFSDPRDIEFAVKDGVIYVLQARPVTTLDQDDDWTVMHEFDSALCCDHELITSANIGEMMPSAVTPLTRSTFFKATDLAGQAMLKSSGIIPNTHNFLKFICSYNNKGFINMHMMTGINENNCMTADKRMAELALMGHTRDDFTMDEVIQYSGKRSFMKRLINGITYLQTRRGASEQMKKWDLLLNTYTIADLSWTSASDLYAYLDKEQHKYIECWIASLDISALSAIWSTVLMAVLSQGKRECEDVFSADVPTALQKLAESIQQSGHMEKLLSLSAKQAADWLLENDSNIAGNRFKEFLQKHGHRCVKEAELMQKSWKSEPHQVVSVIQTMLTSDFKRRKQGNRLSVDEAISNIKTPTTKFGRLVLKWALPKARQAVGNREWGKSVAIKMSEVFKQGYWKLAQLLVREGYLPNEELLFFLTHEEIGSLLQTRSSYLVTRAQRRCKLYPKQLNTVYELICRGHPVSIDQSIPKDVGSSTVSVKLQGMPVSQGIVQGQVRVVRILKDASLIQSEEILIVPYTDVGWSPYFPLISGLVTEMGGLLSHGAVVAREYGLPCIVNVHNATTVFKTGDQVVLNGTNGTIELLM